MQLALPLAAVPRVAKTPSRSRHLTTAGLFAGVGGLELGMKRAKHETKLLCEVEPGACSVLEARFPGVAIHRDVTTLGSLPAGTELLVGGFPCQDLSQAGLTRGIEGKNSGLVGEVFRLLRHQRVPIVLLENVPFMLQLGGGRALDVIVSEFESLGYRWAYRVVDARAFGVPQRRRRVLFLACLDEDPRNVLLADDAGEPPEPDPDGLACGFYWTEGVRGLGWAVDAVPTLKGGSTIGVPSPPAIWMPDGRMVTPDIRDAERMQGFPEDWTKPSRASTRDSHRWKLVGNAVCVPVAKWVGERLARPHRGPLDIPGAQSLLRKGRWPNVAWNVGQGRCTGDVSAYPKHTDRKPLAEYLTHEPKPLSARATRGFLTRTESSSLRFPPGFLDAVRRHLRDVERQEEN